MLREQAAMVRNSAGAGLRKQLNPGHFGQLRKKGPKRGHVQGKEDVWSHYFIFTVFAWHHEPTSRPFRLSKNRLH